MSSTSRPPAEGYDNYSNSPDSNDHRTNIEKKNGSFTIVARQNLAIFEDENGRVAGEVQEVGPAEMLWTERVCNKNSATISACAASHTHTVVLFAVVNLCKLNGDRYFTRLVQG